ncbi:cutinase family protein [Pseudonocardia sp.]|uniref:cutinase family protein n=1 Tax=Pseudonocardia sp. TaxID=60912 RepID=UPI003D097ADC
MALVCSVAATVTAAVLAPASAVAVTPAAGCKAVYFVGSRGSGEQLSDGVNGRVTKGDPLYGMGKPVQRVFTEWTKTLDGIDVGTMYNTYTAASADLLKPSPRLVNSVKRGSLNLDAATTYWYSGVRPFVSSVDLGRGVLITLLTNKIRSCPNTKFVLAGYSQGAMSTHRALKDLQGTKAGAAIIGVFLVADGDRYNTDAHVYGTAPSDAWGVRTTLANMLKTVKPRPADVVNTGIVAEICDKNDIVCDFGVPALRNIGAATKTHSAYADAGNQAIPTAVADMRSRINSKIATHR